MLQELRKILKFFIRVITTDVEKGKRFTSDISKDDLDMWTFSYVVPICPDDF